MPRLRGIKAAICRLEYERSCGMGGEGVARETRNGEAAFGAHEPTRGLARRANPCERIPTDRAHRRASHEREGPENTLAALPHAERTTSHEREGSRKHLPAHHHAERTTSESPIDRAHIRCINKTTLFF